MTHMALPELGTWAHSLFLSHLFTAVLETETLPALISMPFYQVSTWLTPSFHACLGSKATSEIASLSSTTQELLMPPHPP